MKEKETFSLRSRVLSFKYAFEGLVVFFRNEHNAWIHLLATVGVICLAIILPVSKTEILFLVVVMGLVWITELLNTAIERSMDLLSLEKDPKIKIIKDLSAAAVLVAALAALVTGCIIFIPKL